MSSGILRFVAAGVCVVALMGTAAASDKNGSFAVKGIGLERCQRYVEEKSKNSNTYRFFLSWLNGYLSAYNQYVADTFDITPRTRVSELAEAFQVYCSQNPDRTFLEGTISLTRSVAPRRMTERPPAAAQADTAARPAALERETVRQGQQALQDLGLYKGTIDGVMGPGTRSALEAFQRAENLTPTGTFDRTTLARLLAK